MRVRCSLITMAVCALPFCSANAAVIDQVTMRIVAIGTAMPDTVILPLSIETTGKTQADAQAMNRATAVRIKTSVVAIGVEAKDVTVTAKDGADAAANAAVSAMADVPTQTGGEGMTFTSSSSMQIVFDDIRKLSAIQAILVAEKTASVDAPTFITRNVRKARADAINDAIKKARDDADVYAATLGYRVVRITRISNQKASINLPDAIQFVQSMEAGGRKLAGAPTYASVEIDYVIALK